MRQRNDRADFRSRSAGGVSRPVRWQVDHEWTWRRTAWWGGVALATVMACSILSLLLSFHAYSKRIEKVFCYVTDFSGSREAYQTVPNATSAAGTMSAVDMASYVDSGQPFLVSGVTASWPATVIWSHSYFESIFSGHDLFSSTFSTSEAPHFEDGYPKEEVYYGIFLNDHSLATRVANDYQYPEFIPEEMRLYGQLLI